MHPVNTMQECKGAQNATGRIRHACCPPLPKHQGHKGSRMRGEWGEQLPPQASLAAHLRSGGATEPAIHPSGRGGPRQYGLPTVAGHVKWTTTSKHLPATLKPVHDMSESSHSPAAWGLCSNGTCGVIRLKSKSLALYSISPVYTIKRSSFRTKCCFTKAVINFTVEPGRFIL